MKSNVYFLITCINISIILCCSSIYFTDKRLNKIERYIISMERGDD